MGSRERVEEGLLGITALLLLALFALGNPLEIRVAGTAGVAIALIILLILRSTDWHEGGATPFDGILLAGIALSVAHLASILTGADTNLARALLLAAAAFYFAMAILLAHHRGRLFGERVA